VIGAGGPRIVYQPQLSLSRMNVEGYEALARFPDTAIHGTESWFTRAHQLGLGTALEVGAVRRALDGGRTRPDSTTIAINVSPAVLTSRALATALPADLAGVEIEVTEQAWLRGEAVLRRELDRLRARGARVAIDDVGSAHSGLRRVLDLAPDKLKLDRALVHGVATSATRAALVRTVVDLAEQIDATVCAEGVEDLADLATVADLGVDSAQGWAIGRPADGFGGARPGAVRAAVERHEVFLSAPPDRGEQGPDPSSDLDGLLTRLTAVTGLSGLNRLVLGWAPALGAAELALSVLSADGLRLLAPAEVTTSGPVEDFALDAYPLTRACLDTRTVVTVHRDTDPRTAPGPDRRSELELLQRMGFATVLMVAVVSRDRVIGLLECYRRDDAPWTRRQIRSARTAAAMLGPVLDGLTGQPRA